MDGKILLQYGTLMAALSRQTYVIWPINIARGRYPVVNDLLNSGSVLPTGVLPCAGATPQYAVAVGVASNPNAFIIGWGFEDDTPQQCEYAVAWQRGQL